MPETTILEHQKELAEWYVGGKVVFSTAYEGAILDVVKFDDKKQLDVVYTLFRSFQIIGKWTISIDDSITVQTDGSQDEMIEHIDQILGMVNKGLR